MVRTNITKIRNGEREKKKLQNPNYHEKETQSDGSYGQFTTKNSTSTARKKMWTFLRPAISTSDTNCCRITIEQGLLFTRHRKIKTRQENYNIRQDKNLQASTKGWGQSPLNGSLTQRGLARPTSRQSPEFFTGKTKGDEHQRPSSQTQSRQDPGWARVAIGMKCRTIMTDRDKRWGVTTLRDP